MSIVDLIPLPTDVPPPPRMSDVPARIMHSATVETLIDHADDLSSRLKVHIRRNGQLEGQLIELQDQLNESDMMRRTVMSQIEILREKDKAVAEKQAAFEQRLNRSNEELDLSKMEAEELGRRNRELQVSNMRAWAYRRRIKRWVKPGFLSREQQVKSLQAKVLELDAEVLRLTSAMANMREELAHQKSEADRRLTAADRDRARLVEGYEKRISQTEADNARLSSELNRALERVAVLDHATHESARANNERVFFERRTEELEARLKSETERLQGSLNDVAAECATLRASVETARKLREDADQARAHSEELRTRSEAQLKSLRDIWQESSVRLQMLESQNEALEKINGDLSRRLTETRTNDRVRFNDESLGRIGFIEENTARSEKIKKLDMILSDLEMKAFGIQPSSEKSTNP
jgi:chromosome segregation ATPase